MKLPILKILAAILIGFTCSSSSFSQNIHTGGDSLRGKVIDSVLVKQDSSIIFTSKNSADTLVTYVSKDSVVYEMDEKKMKLSGDTKIDYGAFHLQSERVVIDWDASTLNATGIPDTTKGRENKFIGTPKFKEGNEEYAGTEITYNFKSKKGVINYGETKIDEGFYLGEKIKRESDDVYFIRDGKYTTCDNPEHKHYYFGSPKMKFVPKDVVIAEPIVLYIEDVPIFALPFAVIPTKGGRQSGIIPPTFGEAATRGRYLVGGGYYWAMSDYSDLKLTTDWYSKGGYQFNTLFQYNLRYNFSGSIDASYGHHQNQIGATYLPDDNPTTEYRINISHNQDIDPTSNLHVDFSFMTNSYYQNFSTNLYNQLQQNIRSTANYSKSWEGTNRSLNINLSRDQNLVTGTSTNTLPSISFNQSQIFPFKQKENTGNEAWYEMIGFNYSGQFQNSLTTQKRADSTGAIDRFDRRGIRHDISLIASPKAGYFTISPSFHYNEIWYDHQLDQYYDPNDSIVKSRDRNIVKAIRTYDMGLSLSTNLYGTIQPNVFGILGIRHKMTPSISYTYRPDFSKEAFGYYKSYRDSTNKEIVYDPYTGFRYQPGEIFSGVSRGESQSIGVSLGNTFEMKLNPAADDTTQTPRKVQLLNVSASTSYNMVADSFRLSPISLSYHTTVGQFLSLNGSTSFSPYVYANGQMRDRFLVNEGKGLARLTSFSFGFSSNIGSETFASRNKPQDTTAMKVQALTSLQKPYVFSIPWQLSLTYDYRFDQSNPNAKSRSSNIYASLNFTLGDVWKIGTSAYYDIVNHDLGTPNITVSRDLHCWEMSFNWVPTGLYTHYMFVIRLKAPQLQDIKLQKQGSAREIY